MKKKILCTLSVAVIATVAVATIGCTSKKTESVSPKETETPTPIETSAPTETPSKVEADSGEVNTEAYTKEAKELYNAEKDNLSCTEAELTNTYVSLRQQGTSAEDAKANCLTEYMKRPDVQVEDDKKDKPEDYLKKEEEKKQEDYKFKYKEDISNAEDAARHLKSLGYKVSSPVTADEIRAIHKGTKSTISTQELEATLKDPNNNNIVLLILATDTLPSRNSANQETTINVDDSVRPSETNKDKVESTWKPSTQKQKDNKSNIDVDSKDVHHDSIENLDPGLNDLFE